MSLKDKKRKLDATFTDSLDDIITGIKRRNRAEIERLQAITGRLQVSDKISLQAVEDAVSALKNAEGAISIIEAATTHRLEEGELLQGVTEDMANTGSLIQSLTAWMPIFFQEVDPEEFQKEWGKLPAKRQAELLGDFLKDE